MELNKFLCKHFDLENKGHVTLGDFVGFSIIYLIVIGFIIGISYSVYKFFALGSFWASQQVQEETYSFYIVGALVVVVLLIVLGLLILAVLYGLLNYLSNLKIAQCNRK